MAWTAPMTAIAGSVWTAAQFNTTVRDNLLETEVARAQTVSGYSVVTGYQQLSERVAAHAESNNVNTTTSTSYDNLDGEPGPAVTVFTGTRALVCIAASGATSGGTAYWVGYEVSGATSIQASDPYAVQNHVTTTDSWRSGATFGQDGLTPGLNTFTLKYRVSTSGTGSFAARHISVIPL